MNSSKATVNRIMIAAPKSGSGKTMVTCALIRALVKRGLKVCARKCGPDYIDPMFHRNALGVETGNLDPYFNDAGILRYLLASGCKHNDMTVIEGVMGYYDGLGGVSSVASTYDAARGTDTPVILVVDAKGMSVTLSAIIKGLLDYRQDNKIKGVILNGISGQLYDKIASVIEKECGIPALGYMPILPDADIASRHLGLMQPDEIADMDARIDRMAEQLEESVDIDGIIKIAKEAEPLEDRMPEELGMILKSDKAEKIKETAPVIAIARDEAFGFYYDDNIRLLEKLGARIKYFSPMHDDELPEGISGIILYGGYPEEHLKKLCENKTMRASIKKAHEDGIPIAAECGGFMYLQKLIEGRDGNEYEMCGVFPGKAFHSGHLVRFGYMEAVALKRGLYGDAGIRFRGHEFHHWDCTVNGEDFEAEKPMSDKRYTCMVHADDIAAGFPHIYAYAAPELYVNFLYKCSLGIK